VLGKAYVRNETDIASGNGHYVVCEFDDSFHENAEANEIESEEPTLIKPSTKDKLEGNLRDLKGRVKEKAGQVVSDPNLEAEGQAEKLGGKVQKKVGQLEKVLGQ
jgi:uncharacterized protein YjbJ (UPF0337 family)